MNQEELDYRLNGDPVFGIFPQRQLDDERIGIKDSFSLGRINQGPTSEDIAVYVQNLTKTLQLQKGLVVLETAMITYDEARMFMEQAYSQSGLQLTQVMRGDAFDALDTWILSDDTITNLSATDHQKWKTLSIKIAETFRGKNPLHKESLSC